MQQGNRWFWLLTVGIFITACNSNQQKDGESEIFEPGQVWQYHNRQGEDSSTVTILRVDHLEKGDTVVHIRVDGVKIFNPNMAEGYSTFLGHLPYSKQALKRSVVKVTGHVNRLPNFSEGYTQWLKAWKTGHGGYWTVDLADALNALDSVMKADPQPAN